MDRSSPDTARERSTSLDRLNHEVPTHCRLDHYAHQPLTGCVAYVETIAGLLKLKSDGSPNWTADLVISRVGKTVAARRRYRP